MKKVFLGFFAIVIAVSASAFTSKSDIEKTLAPIVYKNLGGGVYSRLVGTACSEADPNPCTITFSNPTGSGTPPDTFTLPSQPSNIGTATRSDALQRVD